MTAAWTRGQRRLHWLVAGAIVLALVLAALMIATPDSARLAKFLLYQAHKNVGLVVFALATWRLALRLVHGRPAWEAGMETWQRRAAGAMHASLHGLGLAVPVLGYLTNATSPAHIPVLVLLAFPLPDVVGPNEALNGIFKVAHFGGAMALLVLAVGHAAVAVVHHRRGSTILAAMLGRK